MPVQKYLITGGAGFIGSNLADSLLVAGNKVTLYDNLSRKNVDKNLSWLTEKHPKNLHVVIDDIQNRKQLDLSIKNQDAVFHLAAQVAVTGSVENPEADFATNASGSLNVLESIRRNNPDCPVIFSSTNKVYGAMENVKYLELPQRYEFVDQSLQSGIDEKFPLDFHSPYGCSKGAADQYFHDYARIYNLHTVVFRQSCIYGPRQFGNEDQGWVMYFLKKIMLGQEINLFGTGRQVRDILFINDLITAYMSALENLTASRGNIYNIGGGPDNKISLLELIKQIEDQFHLKASYHLDSWRPGDQKIFYCNLTKVSRELSWTPQTNIKTGLDKLFTWVKEIIPE